MNKKIEFKTKAENMLDTLEECKEEQEELIKFNKAHNEISDRKAFETFSILEACRSFCPFQYRFENRLRIQCPFGGAQVDVCINCPMMQNTIGNKNHLQEEYATIESIE